MHNYFWRKHALTEMIFKFKIAYSEIFSLQKSIKFGADLLTKKNLQAAKIELTPIDF
jgi:hypothetical protein